MATKFQAIRGMNDVVPSQIAAWHRVERVVRDVLDGYGYNEIRMPIVEPTALFHRSIGEVTDIVEKEMYTFDDRNGDSLTLRPEGTASCVRACVEHGLLYNQQQRLWYAGPMFRHERPQAGRYRQFHQIGVEAFGVATPDIDAELIIMTARIWRALGITDVELQINSLGTSEARAAYRERLIAYLTSYQDVLDEDSRRRLQTNPLRVLDSKTPAMQAMLADAPALIDHLDAESAAHFARLQALLTAAGIGFRINTRLVRGLDYYCKTVFEWVTTRLGAQGTICAGGRYDGLVEQIGGKATPAAGFAMGLERVIGLLTEETVAKGKTVPDVYVVALGEQAEAVAITVAESLREEGLRVLANAGGGSMKSQFKRADTSGAAYAVILGESEVAEAKASVKHLRDMTQEQMTVPMAELVTCLHALRARATD